MLGSFGHPLSNSHPRTMPDEGPFDLLADGTRREILEAAADRDAALEGWSFSELRRAAAIEDSGRFRYHLRELVDELVVGAHGTYRVRRGTLARAIALGACDPHARPHQFHTWVPTRYRCPHCDDRTKATYTRIGELVFYCYEDGVVFRQAVPPTPSGVAPHVWVAVGLRDRRADLDRYELGRCPWCDGPVSRTITRSRPRFSPLDPEDPQELWIHVRCDECVHDRYVPVGVYATVDPAVQAFLAGHGADVRHDPFPHRYLADRTVVETDANETPATVRLCYAVGNDRCTVRVSEGGVTVEALPNGGVLPAVSTSRGVVRDHVLDTRYQLHGLTVGDGLVCAITSMGDCYGIDLDDGHVRWSVPIGGSRQPPAIHDGRLYVGSYDGNHRGPGGCYAIDPASGSTWWEQEVGGLPVSTPAVYDDEVYFGTLYDGVIACGLRTGEPTWHRELPGDGIYVASPVVVDGVIYAGTSDRLLSIDLGARQIRWETAHRPGNGGAVVDDRYVIGTDVGAMALATADGDPVWTHRTDRYTGGPTVIDGLFVFCSHREVFALDRAGQLVWSREEDDHTNCLLGADGGMLYHATMGGTVRALDAATGSIAWTVESRDPIRCAPVFADDVVLLGDFAGRLRAVNRGRVPPLDDLHRSRTGSDGKSRGTGPVTPGVRAPATKVSS